MVTTNVHSVKSLSVRLEHYPASAERAEFWAVTVQATTDGGTHETTYFTHEKPPLVLLGTKLA